MTSSSAPSAAPASTGSTATVLLRLLPWARPVLPRMVLGGVVALVAQLLPLLRAGRARVTSQVSVAANQGAINWDDLNWERSYNGMRAYSQSKIALGLFGLELERRSAEHGWGITSNLSHPGVAPTSLLAARPELGRSGDTQSVRVIRWLSARGILVGTPDSASLPALFAAASPEAVDAWHAAGLANGGTSAEDPPGIRNATEGRVLYLAYLRDPAGNKLCAFHKISG